jgi:hypothetical protein
MIVNILTDRLVDFLKLSKTKPTKQGRYIFVPQTVLEQMKTCVFEENASQLAFTRPWEAAQKKLSTNHERIRPRKAGRGNTFQQQ